MRVPVSLSAAGVALTMIALQGILGGQAGVAGTTRAADTVPVALQASADTYLRSGAPDTNEGGSTFLRLRASGDNRTIVRVDQAALEDAVGDSTVVSASLKFRIDSNGNNWGSSGRTIGAYRLTSVWSEGTGFVDGGSPPNRGTGSGATWACASDSDISNQAKNCSGASEWEMGKPNQPQLHPWVAQATGEALITNGMAGTVSLRRDGGHLGIPRRHSEQRLDREEGERG